MSARDEILNRLRAKSRQVEPPQPWRSRREFDDLAGQYEKALKAVKGEVRHATGLDDALDQLDHLLHQLEVEKVIVDDHPLLEKVDFTGRWPEVHWFIVGRTAGDTRQFAAAADLGLSVADVALAETGSVVMSSGPGHSRLTSLLPPVHAVLLPHSALTPDIFTWTAVREGDWPSSLTLVSGPSKTADIEQTMAVGVHGPKRFIAILFDS